MYYQNGLKNRSLGLLLFLFCACLFLAVPAYALKAITVPWVPSDPNYINEGSYHNTYSGAEITLKGVSKDQITPNIEFRWNFGDGGGTAWTSTTNFYNLGIKHTYTGIVGKTFIATLYVRDSFGDESQDEYRVKIHQSSDLSIPAHLQIRINMSIDEGLWNLHTTLIRSTYPAGSPGYGQPYGYWTENRYGYPLAATGVAVDAFQIQGTKVNQDPNNNPYVETVQRALNYVLVHTYAFNISPQPAGDPDFDDPEDGQNGIGLVANHTSYLYDGRQTYIGGICMTALASSGAPNRVSEVGGAHVYERTYAKIVQDMVDFFAYGQIDSGTYRGGWRYHANYSSADMSTTQWPPLGMLVAEYNMGSVVPEFVRDELELYLDIAQYTGLDTNNGCFAYHYPGSSTYYNITKAAAGIICHEFLGTPLDDPRVESALGYIYRHWNDTGGSWSNQRLLGNSYGMYGVMKSLRIPEPDILDVTEYDYNIPSQTSNSFDWYYTPNSEPREGLAYYCVRTQQADGSWDDVPGPNPVIDAMSTGWHVLILLPEVEKPGPVADICDCDEQEYELNQDIHLDGSCSYHSDPNRRIVSYEWDFDYDGVFSADAVGEDATIVGGYPAEGYYPVALRVTDDNPEGAKSNIIICEIYVHPPPHCPHAYAGGPYNGFVNVAVTFDASGSWDPNGDNMTYEWDLDNDGLYGADDNDVFGEPSDGVGEEVEWTWSQEYTNTVGLRVTDVTDEFDPCTEYDDTTVDIGNHAPVSDPNGPYKAPADKCITLDGSGSYDIDPGDEITYAWDLDNDGFYGADDSDVFGEPSDCVEPQCEFCVGSVIGTVYDLCLKVTDTFGESSIACTTVFIPLNQAPEAVCQDVTVSADSDNCSADASVDNGSFDPDNDTITLVQDPPGPYPLGDTVVTLTVTDPSGEEDNCTATVTVVDDTAPSFVAMASPDVLWPPNHKMVAVTVSVNGVDNCDSGFSSSDCSIVDVTSDEPNNDIGDGNTDGDYEITGDLTVDLRAERQGPMDGRVYTLTVECVDDAGNTSTSTAGVNTPHSKIPGNVNGLMLVGETMGLYKTNCGTDLLVETSIIDAAGSYAFGLSLPRGTYTVAPADS